MAKVREKSKANTFTEREIKAFLQVCRGLDKEQISEAVRSRQFLSVRAKFQRMAEKLQEPKGEFGGKG